MPVPKKKKSRSRRDKRRSHDALTPAGGLHNCPACGATKRSHHVCGNCGQYRGRQVLSETVASE
ncbi:50S ribosomal protein L32 [Myxococcota bacterium]|nr:50S ribosomal protein L32 [Myxococcota bacterium]